MLLEDYLRHLPPSSSDFDDTTNALRIVSEAAEHANDTVKQGVSNTRKSKIPLKKNKCDTILLKDKFQRMLSLQQRLGDWELVRPGRELLKEGMLQKISRKGVSFCQRPIFGHLSF